MMTRGVRYGVISMLGILHHVTIITIVFLCVLLHLQLAVSENAELRDYCLKESFEAECPHGQIIVIENAQYGRMRLGRCIEKNYGYIGCANNVTRVLASKCSGRQQCTVVNLEAVFTNQKCPSDLTRYLEAQYSCMQVTTASQTECHEKGQLTVTSPTGLLSSAAAQDGDLGTDICPWHLQAEEGQHFEIFLWDFADYSADRTDSAQNPRYCRIYAFISEENQSAIKDVVACDGQPSVQQVYVSTGNNVRIKFMATPASDPMVSHYYVIQYKAVGCVHPKLPDRSHIMYHGNGSISIQCNDTQESYTVHCSADGKYVGSVGNCSNAGAFQGDRKKGHYLSYGMAIVIIITVAILICMLILTLGLLHYKKRRRFDGRGHHVRLHCASNASDTADRKMMLTFSGAHGNSNSLPSTPKKQRYAVERSPMVKAKTLGRTQSLTRGEYAHIWEIRRPIPVATPKVPPPEGERSEPDGTPRTQTMERRPHEAAAGEEFPLPPTTFMTFKPLGDHVYESPRFASLAKPPRGGASRTPAHFDTCLRNGKPIPPRRSLDQGDRNRLRTMGMSTTQRRFVPEPSPGDEGKITV